MSTKVCKLCGLVVDEIPADAVQVGRLHTFADGTLHLFRRLTKEKQRRPPRNPDNGAPMGTHAYEVPR